MKRAQIQLGETIFVTIILVVLIVVGISIYAQAQTRDSSTQQELLQDLDAIAISKYLTSISELQCSSLQVQKATCFDKYKLEAFVLFAQNHPDLFEQYYFTQLGNAKLSIKQLYPVTEDEEWVLYFNELGENPRRTTTSLLPISIYDPVFDQYQFGVVTLETYYR